MLIASYFRILRAIVAERSAANTDLKTNGSASPRHIGTSPAACDKRQSKEAKRLYTGPMGRLGFWQDPFEGFQKGLALELVLIEDEDLSVGAEQYC